MLTYVLVTPARNEAAFIEQTIRSVINQTQRPLQWAIVSDGSTDGTDEIVSGFAVQHRWIKFKRMPERKERHFAGKVHAFNAGYELLRHLDFDAVGSLDADISFEPDYFSFLLQRLKLDACLGVVGAPFRDAGSQYDYNFSRREHVSGACQLFRRSCFESMGGYTPLRHGGVDLVAVVTARMKGWKTQTFTEKYCVHHRPMGTAQRGPILSLLKSGYGDYRLGVHPLWQMLRSTYQMSRKPIVVGGASLLLGYLFGVLTHPQRPVSNEFVAFRRREQLRWLREYLDRGRQMLRFPRPQRARDTNRCP